MLCLIRKNEIIQKEIPENSRFTLPEGEVVSPAYAGWKYKDFTLIEIQESNDIPAGKKSESVDVVLKKGKAMYVHNLVDDIAYSADVDIESNRRIHAGFVFEGKLINYDDLSHRRITSLATQAMGAISKGVLPGNYRWHSSDEDFYWITADNSKLRLDAQGMVELQSAGASWESAHVLAASKLKSQLPIPVDYKDDVYWP